MNNTLRIMSEFGLRLADKFPPSDYSGIGRRLAEPIVIFKGNSKAYRRWRRRNIPNSQRAVK